MAETEEGKKFNRIPAYTRTVNGKPQQVKPHIRSNPSTSRGAEPKK